MACKSQEQSLEPAHEPLQSSPKRYSTFDPMQQLSTAPPNSNLERAPPAYPPGNLAQPQAPGTTPPKKGRTPLGRTPLSSTAAAFKPGQFQAVPFFCPPQDMNCFGQPWMMDPHFPMNPNGFQLNFSAEMPNCDKPSVEAVQELDAEHSVAQPFETLLGKFEVSDGILVPKGDESSDDCPAPEVETPGKLHGMQLPASAVEDK